MQQQQQQNQLQEAMKAFSLLSETEKSLFLGVVDVKYKATVVATKQQQNNKSVLPKEFSEAYLYADLVRTHNASVKKRLAKYN